MPHGMPHEGEEQYGAAPQEDPEMGMESMGFGPALHDEFEAPTLADEELMALLGLGYSDAGDDEYGASAGAGAQDPMAAEPGAPADPMEAMGMAPSNTPMDRDAVKAASFDLLSKAQDRNDRSKWFQSQASTMQNRRL